MKTLKVVVTLTDGRSYWANAFLEDSERLQDLLNDSRKFIPFNVFIDERSTKADTYRLMIIHKDSITTIEER